MLERLKDKILSYALYYYMHSWIWHNIGSKIVELRERIVECDLTAQEAIETMRLRAYKHISDSYKYKLLVEFYGNTK